MTRTEGIVLSATSTTWPWDPSIKPTCRRGSTGWRTSFAARVGSGCTRGRRRSGRKLWPEMIVGSYGWREDQHPSTVGFLEWLWRLGDLPCEVIDLTNMPVGSRRGFSLCLLPGGGRSQATASGTAPSHWMSPPESAIAASGVGSVPRTRRYALSTPMVFDPRRSPSLTSSWSPSPKPAGKSPRRSLARRWGCSWGPANGAILSAWRLDLGCPRLCSCRGWRARRARRLGGHPAK